MNIIKGKTRRANRVLLYGVEGVGKTTLSASLPDPLILDTEDGSHQLDVARVRVRSLDSLLATVDEIVAQKKAGAFEFKTVILDTADRVWNMSADWYLEEKKAKRVGEDKFGTQYKEITEIFCQMMRKFDRIANAGVHVVIVCHCKTERVSPPDNPDYTMYQVKVSAPGKQAEESREFLKQWADAVLFCMFEATVNKDTGKAVGGNTRKIKTVHAAAWEAKNRVGLPEEVEMSAQALAPLFPDLGGSPAVPPELHHEPVEQPRPEAAQPRDVRDQMPQAILAHEEAVLAYCVSKGGIKPGQGWDNVPEKWVAKIQQNPAAILKAAGITTGEGAAQ